jgi:small subunit ribosomal protein S6
VFIARQDISVPQVEALTEGFTKVIEDHGGKVTKCEQWGLRPFAFRIRKHRKGYYVLLNIDAVAAGLHEMERQMRISEDILRFMTVRVDELEEGPSAIMQARSGRGDERPRRADRARDGDQARTTSERPKQAEDEVDDEPEDKAEAEGDDEVDAEAEADAEVEVETQSEESEGEEK